MITPEIIERFIAGKCSSNEEKAVFRHFEENSPEDKELYKSGEILMNEKFNLPISEGLSAKILERIYETISAKKKFRKRWITSISAAAALIILVIGVRFYFSFQNTIILPPPVEIAQNQISKTNRSSLTEIVPLSDGSEVALNPGSAISYLPDFEPDKRDIYLKGEALFKVAKDSTRPFTVTTHKVSATALGTEFRVKSSSRNIVITLYKGKIIVKKTGNISEKYYLNPGNAISYNILSEHFSMMNELKKLPASPKFAKNTIVKKLPANLSLNNTTLKYAFDQLAEKFNVEIEYSPEDINNINIIATITPSQSIERVLENITQLNGLTLVKSSPTKFLIRKPID